MRVLLASLLIAVSIGPIEAQAPAEAERYIFSVRHYGPAEGLPHRGVSAIAQDKLGFIWVATQMGVARFDGYTFVNHTRADGLGMDLVKTVLCDADGLPWLWHPDGQVNILDPLSGKCTALNAWFGERAARTNGPVRGICAGNDGTIAFSQGGQLVRYRNVRAGFETMSLQCAGDLIPWRVEANGDIWCQCMRDGTPEQESDVLLVSAKAWKQGQPSNVKRIPDVLQLTLTSHDLSGADVAAHAGAYLFLKSGQAWLSPEGRLTEMHDGTERSVLNALGSFPVRLQLTDDIWLVNGTVRRMRASDNALTAAPVFDIASVFPEVNYGVSHALRDRMGNIWIAGQFGLFKLTLRPDHVQRWLWDSTLVSGVGVNVRGMTLIGDQLHVNTQHNDRWTIDAHTGVPIRSWGRAGNGLAIIPDGEGGLWRSSSSQLIHSLRDGTEDRMIQLPEGRKGAWSLLLLGPERLLIGTEHGLLLWNGGKDVKELEHPQHARFDEASIWYMQRDADGSILCCTEAGLFAVNDAGEVLDHWGYDAPPVNGVPHRLPADDIRHLLADGDHAYWLATAAQGLVRWDKSTGSLRTVGVKEGLLITSIHAVYADHRGALWMPTDNGLVRYDPANGQVKVFTTADGITNNEFNRIAHAQGPDGRLYFGGFNGITSIDPEQLRAPITAPAGQVELTGVQLQSRDSIQLTDLTTAVRGGAPIVLRPGDRFFTVGMALLNYDDPSQIRYAWRIDGEDQNWNMQAEPNLRLSALPYGDHMLRIKALDADARWSANELTIPIVVLRPFYLRWWFFALCAFTGVAIIYALFRYRVQQLQQVIRVRDLIAMDLHDEVGSSLSGIVIFSEAVKDEAGDLSSTAADMLQRIADNSTRAMESMNDIVWSANSRHDHLADVLHRMRAYAQPLCEAAGIDIEFNVDIALLERKLGMQERKSLYLIFKEAVNNAVKHARCTRIEVTLRPAEKRVELTVADNGIGMSGNGRGPATLGGNGLGNMRRRAKDVRAELELQPREGGGTSVVFRMPAGR